MRDELCGRLSEQLRHSSLVLERRAEAALLQLFAVALCHATCQVDAIESADREREVARDLPKYLKEQIHRAHRNFITAING